MQNALRQFYRHLKLRNFTLPVDKLRNTHHQFKQVLVFFRQSVLWLRLLQSALTT